MWQVFKVFLKLGLTSFGGPVAHLGFFRHEFVERRQWISDQAYADLVALCQFLPGPASSQVGMAVGYYQAGFRGSLAAWLGFTAPSAFLMILFAIGLNANSDWFSAPVIQGLKLVALAVVAQAIWAMGKSLCNTVGKFSLMLLSAAALLVFPSVGIQLGLIALGAVVGIGFFKATFTSYGTAADPQGDLRAKRSYSYLGSIILLSTFMALLLGLPFLVTLWQSSSADLVDVFYRVGSLVFGGGHVVLPLLQAELVPEFVAADHFLAGYGVAQAVPGPLFTFAAFLGAASPASINPWFGGLLCLLAIFLPSFLLVFGVLPFWDRLRQINTVQAALIGVNAVVVGILVAAFYQPIWQSTINSSLDLGLAAIALIALQWFKMPPWLIVACAALCGFLVNAFF